MPQQPSNCRWGFSKVPNFAYNTGVHIDTSVPHDKEGIYDLLFRLGMYWRILYGTVRFVFGFFALRLVGTPLSELFYRLMRHEVLSDPGDLVLNVIGSFLDNHAYKVTYFLAIYFIIWGAIEVVLSINLLKKHVWAFPTSIYLIIALMVYEIYRVTRTHSLILLGVIFVDLFLIWVIRHEYRKLLAERARMQS